MTMLFDQAIGLSVVLSVVLAASLALRRCSAALRHCVLAAGIVSSLALPLARPFVPAWGAVALPTSIQAGTVDVASTAATEGAARQASRRATTPAPRPPARAGVPVVTAWAAGAVVSLLVLLAGITRLAWHARHARVLRDGPWKRAADRIGAEMGLRRTVSVLETTSASMLGAWGWRSPRVLLPRGAGSWRETDVDLVMRHELAHIARADWATQLFGEALRAVYWFNPLTWIVCARLRLESERACDDEVLRAGVRGDDYALCLVHLATLLRSATRWAPHAAPGMARSTSLRRRVTAMLDPALSRTGVTARSRVVVGGLTVALTLAVAGLAVLAQARFSGSVVDASGKRVANVPIVLTHAQTKARHELRSDDQGRFDFAALPAGTYDMEASLPGFMTVRGSVDVASAGVARDITLQLGSVRETLTITAPKPPGTTEAPRQPPPATPCVATAMGGNVRPPMKLIDVRPDYPASVYAAKIGGLVVAEGILAKDGTIRELRVVQAAHPDLGNAVKEAVGRWRFTPTLLNCEPADISIRINTNFVVQQP